MKFTMAQRAKRPRPRPPRANGFAGDEPERPAPPAPARAAPRTAAECRSAGNQLAEVGRFGAALVHFDEALASAPRDHELHELRAQALLAMDRCFDAAAAADDAIALQPRWVDAHLTKARALLNYGEPDLALESFRRAAALAPGDGAIRAEVDAAADIAARRGESRTRLLAAAADAADPDAAEVLRCKAALRCTVDD